MTKTEKTLRVWLWVLVVLNVVVVAVLYRPYGAIDILVWMAAALGLNGVRRWPLWITIVAAFFSAYGALTTGGAELFWPALFYGPPTYMAIKLLAQGPAVKHTLELEE